MILFPDERFTRPRDVREHVRVHQPDRGPAPVVGGAPVATPPGSDPPGDRLIPPPASHGPRASEATAGG